MKNDLRDRWCTALESGGYEQGKSALRKDGQYCCLGVLCDIMDPNGWTPGYDKDKDSWQGGFVGVISESLCGNIGLNIEDHNRLISMNDTDVSFREIAVWIRENV